MKVMRMFLNLMSCCLCEPRDFQFFDDNSTQRPTLRINILVSLLRMRCLIHVHRIIKMMHVVCIKLLLALYNFIYSSSMWLIIYI